MHTQHPITIQRAIYFACVLLCVVLEGRAVYAESPPPSLPALTPPSPSTTISGRSLGLLYSSGENNLGILIPADIDPDSLNMDAEPPPEGMYYVNDVLQPAGTDFVQIAANDEGCWALKKTGQIVGWNAYGWFEYVGPSDLSELRGPFVNRGFTEIDATDDTICGYRRGGAAMCWGDGWYLGAGGMEQWKVQTIAAANGSACALVANGELVCISDEWEDEYPQRGHFRALDCGSGGACCALRDNGQASCWGSLDTSPRVGGFSQISVDYETACGVRLDGRLACWSESDAVVWSPALDGLTHIAVREIACGVSGGQLVCWDMEEMTSPVQVLAEHVVQAELEQSHVCALYADGSVMMHPIPDNLQFADGGVINPPLPLQWIQDQDEYSSDDGGLTPPQTPNGRVLSALLGESTYDQAPPLWIHLGAASPSDLMPKNKGLSDSKAYFPWTPVGGAPTAWALQVNLKSLVARDLTTGKQRWQRPIPPDAALDVMCATESAGVVMVVFSDESVQGFDAKTGAPRWTLPEDFRPEGLCEAQVFPGSAGFVVLAPDPEPHAGMPSLARLNPVNGQVVWRAADPFYTAIPPRPHFLQTDALGSVAWFGEIDSEAALIALEPTKGAQLWRWSAPSGQMLRGFALAGDRVWVLTTEAAVGEELPTRGIHRHHLTALRRADGLPDPSVRPSLLYSPPVDGAPKIWALPDVLVVMTGEGLVRVIDPASGVMRWSWGLGQGLDRVGVWSAEGGSWLAARVLGSHDVLDGSGSLLLPLHAKPESAPFVVNGSTDAWGPLLIAGQMIYPAQGHYYSAEILAGGFLHLYGSTNRCADPAALGGFDVSATMTRRLDLGALWLPLMWDEVGAECP